MRYAVAMTSTLGNVGIMQTAFNIDPEVNWTQENRRRDKEKKERVQKKEKKRKRRKRRDEEKKWRKKWGDNLGV